MNYGDSLEQSKLDHGASADAAAEGGELIRISARDREEDNKRSLANRVHPVGVCQERHGSGPELRQIAEEGLAAVIVHCHDELAVLGQIVGADR